MTAKTETPSRVLCQLHPNVDYKHAWGCPECVAELRKQATQLRETLGRADEWRKASEHEYAKLEQANQILSEACAKALNERDAWREVAGRLAGCLRSCKAQWQPQNGVIYVDGMNGALSTYDALAKLSDGGKG